MSDTLQTPQAMVETKKAWQSRTLWIGLVAAIVPFFPPAAAVIAANPEVTGLALSGIFSALRMITKDRVVIK